MNKTYRIVWSETRQAFVVANEKAATHGKPSSTRKAVAQTVVAALMALGAGQALAVTSCPGAGGAITVAGADDETCTLVTGDSLTVNAGGSIAASSTNAVYVGGGVTVGSITNHGTISATGSSVAAINIFSGTVSGGITNHGTISATGSSFAAINIENSTVGGITNSGMISAQPSGGGAIVISNSTITGSITNSGLIEGQEGVEIRTSTISGGISNSGTIAGDRYGIYVRTLGTIGGLTNSGTISAQNTGVYVANTSTISGGITNNGTINGRSAAFYVRNSTISGGFTNIGMISATNAAIYFTNSTLTGKLTNSGTIGSGVYGVELSGSTLNDGLHNSGVINGTAWGMLVSSSAINGGLTNSGTITSSATGIQLRNNTLGGGLTNSGTISGGTYAINVDGSSSLNSLTIAGNNTARFIGEVNAPNTPVTLSSGATYTMQGGELFTLNGTSTGFTNNGILGVAAGTTGTITGAYTQAAGATFRTHVTDNTTYGKLLVSGTATLPSNAKIDVNVADPNFSFTASSMANIISASTLTSDGTFAVTDNSLLFNFAAVKDGNTVDLTITAAAPAVLASVTNTGNTPATGAAAALDTIIAGDPTGPIGSLFVGFTTEQQVSDAVSQTLPLLTGASQVAGSAALTGINRVIQARQEANRGLSSGDLFYGDKKFWVKPFGSWADQDDRNGVSGYKAKTGGLAFGADATISNETRLGLSFAYARAAVDSNSSVAPNSMDVDVYQLVGYGSHVLDADSEINFQAGIGQNRNDGRRDLLAFGTVAKADFTSQIATAGVGYGRTLKLGEQTGFTPALRADYTRIRDKGYTETGAGAMNLNVGSRTTDELILAVDGKLTHEIATGRTVSANLGLGYDVLGEQASITAAYAGAPTVAFTTRGLDPSPWMVRGGLGLSNVTANGVEVSARYDVETRQGSDNQTLSVKARWAF